MNNLKILPIGGLGQVTKNMFLYEWGNERLIIDCGIGFPEVDMLGVDFLIPDISYLKGKEDTVHAIILTHGHDDHIGGLPYILPKLLPSMPVYASPLTLGFIKDTLADFNLTANLQKLPDTTLNLGAFKVDSAVVTHSVPDARHFLISTPEGTVYHGSDYKIDLSPVDNKKMDLQKISHWGHKGVDLLLIDCLRVEKAGFTPSEANLTEVFEREIADTKGRFIITTMSSNIHRIQQAVNVIIKNNRQVSFLGRSVEENIKTAVKLNYFRMPPNKQINKRKIKKIDPGKIGMIVAGSQGQIGSTLDRISKGEYDNFKIEQGDKIVFSTDVIPGNQNYYYPLIDRLSRLGVQVSYYDILDDLHVSGHASRGEQELMLSLIKPKYILPIGGTFRHMIQYRHMAEKLDYDKNRVFLLEEGQSLNLQQGKVNFGSAIDLKTIIVDGLGIGDVGKIVLADRRKMADDGIVVIVIQTDKKSKMVLVEPEIITRGFVYVRKSQVFLEQIQKLIGKILPQRGFMPDYNKAKEDIGRAVSEFIYKETEREPMILPVIMEV